MIILFYAVKFSRRRLRANRYRIAGTSIIYLSKLRDWECNEVVLCHSTLNHVIINKLIIIDQRYVAKKEVCNSKSKTKKRSWKIKVES